MKRRICAIIIAIAMVITSMPITVVDSFAATNQRKTQGDIVASIAYECRDMTLQQVKNRFKEKGYTSWSKNFEGEWCGWFISNCARAAKVSTAKFPNNVWARHSSEIGFYEWAKKKGTLRSSNYVPKKGDICFFYGVSKEYGHVEVVYKVENGKVYTVGGNRGLEHWSITKSGTRSFSIGSGIPSGYAEIDYDSLCQHPSTNSSTGKCKSCGESYFDYDGAKTGANTSYSANRFYKLVRKTSFKVYPSKSADSGSTWLADTNVNVVGTVKGTDGNTWYKVKNGSSTANRGYVSAYDIVQYTPVKSESTVSIAGAKDTYTLRHGAKVKLTATASSNYPIKTIDIAIGSAIVKKVTTQYPYLKNSVSLQSWTGVDLSKLASGTYNYRFTVTDISGKEAVETGKFIVSDGIKTPTIKESLKEEGKDIVITRAQSSGTIYYRVNNGSWQTSTANPVPVHVTEAGTTKVEAFVWTADNKRSGNVTKSFKTEKLEVPGIHIDQEGKKAKVTFMAANSKDSIRYKLDGGSYKTYDGSVLEVADDVTISAYATRKGALRSEVVTEKTELGEPDMPEVKTVNEDGKVAAGQNATFCWNEDRRADSYSIALYEAESGKLVEEKTTTDTTVSFLLKEAGEYYAEVTAENEIGKSERSETAEVTAVAPLTVTLLDGTGEDAKVLAEVKVDYGSTPEVLQEPSRKGYNFDGWENLKTGVVSRNAYTKNAVKEDTSYAAVYSKKTYEVKLYDTDGTLIEIQKVPYGEAADTESISVKLKDGYVFAGWHVSQTAEGDSNADYTCVDSDMELRAVAAWADRELPVRLEVQSAEQTADGRYVNAKLKVTTDGSEDLSLYLVGALKAKDSESGVEKTVYADRKIMYLDAGESEQTVSLKLKADGKGISSLEVTALQCNDDLSTGSAYSKTVSQEVVLSKNWGEWSEWSSDEAVSTDSRDAESRIEYRERNKEYTYSGYSSLSGYTKEGSETISTTYGGWRSSKPAASVTENSANKTTVSAESTSAYRWYAYYCDCKKVCWKTTGGTCSYCGEKTKNALVVYTKVLANVYDSDGSGHFKPTLTATADGNTRSIYWNGSPVSSFTTKAKTNLTYLWKSDPLSRTIYRSKTVKSRNLFSKWGEWSEWSGTEISATAAREVEKRTMYRYRDLETETTGSLQLDPDGILTRSFEGTIGVEEDLKGKVATIMVYQANNTDPNRYQMQYLGQTEIGEGNTYDFSFIPKDEPTAETGNYIVSMAVQGTTALITAGIVEAPAAEHTVKLYYTDKDGNRTELGEVQTVKHHGDADLSGIAIPELEGYYFAGWSRSVTDVTEDREIEAVYVPVQNAVVFVDWIHQNLDIQKALTGTKIALPGALENAEGYSFTGWKLEDGTVLDPAETTEVEVTGDMVITAVYEPETYTVRFLAPDGSQVDSQNVPYGEAAQPPAYEPESGSFVGWSTDSDWWNVKHDVDVYPVIVYDESALKPEGNLMVDGETDEVSLEMTTEEPEGSIYYTTDGTLPTAEKINEFLNTEEGDYAGSVKKYEGPLVFEEDTYVTAVTYASGKTESEPETILVSQEVEEPGEVTVSEEEGWTELKNVEVKAQGGKDVTVEVVLPENPGLTAYEFLVSCDEEVFYADRNEYDEPVCESGIVSEGGLMMTKETEEGIRTTWISEEASNENGKLFSLTLHVNEEAEAGMYPVAVSYARENTLDGDYCEADMEGAQIMVKSEASVDISSYEINLSRTSYVYEGKAVEPAVTIEGLKEGEDYKATYENNVNAGIAKAVIQGIGGYEGSVEKTFEITPANIVNVQTGELGSTNYTGSAIEPDPELIYNDAVLVKGRDYELTYADNVEVGTGRMTVTGKGNFTGSSTKEFAIEKSQQQILEELMEEVSKLQAELKAQEEALKEASRIDISGATVTVQGDYTYTGSVIKPAVSVKYGTKILKEGTDYVMACENNLKAGTADFIVNGIGSFDGRVEKSFVIKPASITNVQAGEIGTAVYTGNALNPKFTVHHNGILLAEGKDYELVYTDNVDIGTGRVMVNGKGNFTGSITKTFTITKSLQNKVDELHGTVTSLQQNLSDKDKELQEAKRTDIIRATVTLQERHVYTGKDIRPAVQVTYKNKTLKEGTDYTVAYENNCNEGTAKVIVTGTGSYKESITKTFEIVKPPAAVSGLKAELYGYNDISVSWKASTGATAYKVYQKKGSGSYRLVKTTKELSYKKADLTAGVKYTFKVVPYRDELKGAEKTSAVYTLKKVSGVKVTKSGSKVKVSWKNINGESGYQISKMATKGGTQKKLTTYKTTNGKTKKLSAAKGKTFYYKVRAYKQIGKTKIYGPWSAVKMFKR